MDNGGLESRIILDADGVCTADKGYSGESILCITSFTNKHYFSTGSLFYGHRSPAGPLILSRLQPYTEQFPLRVSIFIFALSTHRAQESVQPGGAVNITKTAQYVYDNFECTNIVCKQQHGLLLQCIQARDIVCTTLASIRVISKSEPDCDHTVDFRPPLDGILIG